MSVPERPELRIGDEVRNRVVDDLRIHFAAGRLDIGEFEDRTAAALAATTIADLQPLLRDLPAARPRPSGPPVRQPVYRPSRGGDAAYRTHVAIWASLAAFFVLIWVLTTPGGYFWPVWPMLGTGLPLIIHTAARRANR